MYQIPDEKGGLQWTLHNLASDIHKRRKARAIRINRQRIDNAIDMAVANGTYGSGAKKKKKKK